MRKKTKKKIIDCKDVRKYTNEFVLSTDIVRELSFLLSTMQSEIGAQVQL